MSSEDNSALNEDDDKLKSFLRLNKSHLEIDVPSDKLDSRIIKSIKDVKQVYVRPPLFSLN